MEKNLTHTLLPIDFAEQVKRLVRLCFSNNPEKNNKMINNCHTNEANKVILQIETKMILDLMRKYYFVFG